jgi:adenylyl-sulfate kinase
MTTHLFPVYSLVPAEERRQRLKQRPLLIWFTGLSGSGKSTLAVQLERKLFDYGLTPYLLDGDALRSGLNRDLDFSIQGRRENIRRTGEVCRLLLDAGLVVITAFISPFREDRQRVRQTVGAERYVEIFTDAPLHVCEQRDVKGLYQKARAGALKDFTGISAPYEVPEHPDLTLHTDAEPVEESVQKLLAFILPRIVMTPQTK